MACDRLCARITRPIVYSGSVQSARMFDTRSIRKQEIWLPKSTQIQHLPSIRFRPNPSRFLPISFIPEIYCSHCIDTMRDMRAYSQSFVEEDLRDRTGRFVCCRLTPLRSVPAKADCIPYTDELRLHHTIH